MPRFRRTRSRRRDRRPSRVRGALARAQREVEQQKLLATPIADLKLRPTGVLAECIEQVSAELRKKGLTFVPAYYLGDDDFWTADRAVSVNIPWYLATPELWRLVNDHLVAYTRDEVLMYLRHESAHAVNYAFRLWKRPDWRHMFGDFRRAYRDVYTPHPWSRDFVRYLHEAGMYHYAQKHPDEDFAETFATWLDPDSGWRRAYRKWPVALAKLEYVDRIVEVERACRGTPPNLRPGFRIPYSEIKGTVAEYFEIDEKIDPELVEFRKDLLDIFARRPSRQRDRARAVAAARFIQQHQTLLVDRLTKWIGRADRWSIKRFLRQAQAICTHERLVVPESRRNEILVELTIVATWHVVDDVHRLSE